MTSAKDRDTVAAAREKDFCPPIIKEKGCQTMVLQQNDVYGRQGKDSKTYFLFCKQTPKKPHQKNKTKPR